MQIWKFPLEVTDIQQIQMPKGAEILCVQVQREIPCLWAMVDEHNEKVTRHIRIYGTGHMASTFPSEYIGTFQIHGGSLVFHVFEVPLSPVHTN